MSDLLEVIAVSSGMTKFFVRVSKSCSFWTGIRDSHLCRLRQSLTTASQCTVGKALDFDILGLWSGIKLLDAFY